MQAIEFEIDINDEFIRIPHFEQLKDKHVKIILLYNEEEKQNRILPNIFYNPVITTQYEPFQREEIYRE
ncbi:MAG: hypothetical protein HC877_08570 [Thioploca sp.]|nr:hypothetical protein [Thioploca sp.]